MANCNCTGACRLTGGCNYQPYLTTTWPAGPFFETRDGWRCPVCNVGVAPSEKCCPQCLGLRGISYQPTITWGGALGTS